MSQYENIYDVVRLIPPGRVTSYGAIAKLLLMQDVRQVGWAMHQSFFADPPVPAHRVVNRFGELSGRNHFSTPTKMQELLEAEGVVVEDNKVKEFDTLFWDPHSIM